MASILDRIVNVHLPKPRYKILNPIHHRWSPRNFSDETIPVRHLNQIFEAARWAPSGHNYQPWHFYYTKKGTKSYQKLLSTLNAYNKSWAHTAPVFIVACAVTRNKDGDNPYAFYDLGASALSLVLQAQSLGYYSRQMALFNKNDVKKFLKLSGDVEPFVIIAVGKIGDYRSASKELQSFEMEERPRKSTITEELF